MASNFENGLELRDANPGHRDVADIGPSDLPFSSRMPSATFEASLTGTLRWSLACFADVPRTFTVRNSIQMSDFVEGTCWSSDGKEFAVTTQKGLLPERRRRCGCK